MFFIADILTRTAKMFLFVNAFFKRQYQRRRMRFPIFFSIGITLESKYRRQFLAGGRICTIVAERLLCMSGQPALHFKYYMEILSRRHFFKEPPAAICVSTFKEHAGVKSIAFNETKAIMATCSIYGVRMNSLSPDGTNPKHVASLMGNTVTSLTFHETKPLLACGGSGNNAILYHLSDNGTTATNATILAGHSGIVYSVAFHPSLPLLATGSSDNTAKLWQILVDGKSATCISTLKGHHQSVMSVAFHSSLPLLATGSSDKTVKIWNLSADSAVANCVATLEGHSDFVFCVAFHRFLRLRATGSSDKTAKIWNFSPDGAVANCVATLQEHDDIVCSVDFNHSAPVLVTASNGYTRIYTMTPYGTAATCVATLKGPSKKVLSVKFHPAEPVLAIGGDDGLGKLYK